MRIAVCENNRATAQQLCEWIRQYCVLYQIPAAFQCFFSPSEFSNRKERYHIVFMAFGGVTGFAQTRQLREVDRECSIILVDDTPDFAVRCVRLHCTDFILRPVKFRQVVRSMRLALGGRV